MNEIFEAIYTFPQHAYHALQNSIGNFTGSLPTQNVPPSDVFNIAYLTAIFVVATFGWFALTYHNALVLAKNCRVVFNWPDEPKHVGDTVTFGIFLYQLDGRAHEEDNLAQLMHKTSVTITVQTEKPAETKEDDKTVKVSKTKEEIKPEKDAKTKETNTKEVTELIEHKLIKYMENDKGLLVVTFNVEIAGIYEIHLVYEGFIIPGSPFRRNFSQNVPDPTQSQILSLQQSAVDIKESINLSLPPNVPVAKSKTQMIIDAFKPDVPIINLFEDYSYSAVTKKNFKTGEVDPSKTKLEIYNPHFVCVQTSLLHTITLDAKDQYGNTCNARDIDLSLFRFVLKDVQPLSGTMKASIFESGFVFSEIEDHFSLWLKTPRDSIYRASLYYSGIPIQNGFDFTVISLSSDEEASVEQILTNGGLLNSLFAWESTHFLGILKAVGDETNDISRNPTNVRITIVPRYISVEEDLGILYWGKASYAITKNTRINFIECVLLHDELKYSICLSDGFQASMTLLMKPGDARIFLNTFALFQGDKLRVRSSFEEKKKNFQNQLCGTSLFWRFSKRNIQLYRCNLVESLLLEVQNFAYNDWCAYFSVSYVEETLKVPVRKVTNDFEWLTLICDEIFESSSTGMFSSLGSTNLIHPNLSTKRNPKWKEHHYQLAGKILGKCLYEAAVMGKSFLRVRFTRSLLAKFVGLPINYTHLVQDNPEECWKIKEILNSQNVDNLELTFTAEVDEDSNKYEQLERFFNWIGFPTANNNDLKETPKPNLIPEGSNVKVTNENKISYLNAMAQYELEYKFHKEIDALREGFYTIVAQELVSDMSEYDLDLLLCGGAKFYVNDLKDHHVMSTCNVRLERQKVILSWLWSSITNMNEEKRGRLLQLVTGTCVLPAGGFKELYPSFTISIKESFGQKPFGIPSLHVLSLSDHNSFEAFETNLLDALRGEWRQQ